MSINSKILYAPFVIAIGFAIGLCEWESEWAKYKPTGFTEIWSSEKPGAGRLVSIEGLSLWCESSISFLGPLISEPMSGDFDPNYRRGGIRIKDVRWWGAIDVPRRVVVYGVYKDRILLELDDMNLFGEFSDSHSEDKFR